MLLGGESGAVELRQAGDGTRIIAGRFPYRVATVLQDGPSPRREVFEPRAFSPRLEAGANVHLLFAHDFSRPLANRTGGSLLIEDGDDALTFEARLSPQIAQTSHGRDVLVMIETGLALGLSPGFRVPEGGAVVTADGPGLLRTVTRAELFELSIVAVPAYDDAAVEARNWMPQDTAPPPARRRRGRAFPWR